MNTPQEELRARLRALGFDDVRFARLDAVPAGHLRGWLADGMHADMAWMERTAEKRLDPEQVLPGARSAILLGVNYWPGRAEQAGLPRWARYALYSDYHDTIKPALIEAGKAIEQLYDVTGGDYRYYVDTGPVLERGWAVQAGLGFVGKNGMLISRQFGNWLFLAAIFTRVEFSPDAPLRATLAAGRSDEVGLLCGKCTRCMDACPTGAIRRPGVVDARRCISYQTIENRGIVPRELRAGIGDRIYGCDICLEVCPWNRFAQQSRTVLLQARDGIAGLALRDVLQLTPERFAEIFRKTAIKRVKLAGLLRNACIVAGNTNAQDCLDVLVKLASHETAMVRVHAVWAVHRLVADVDARRLLAAARTSETDPAVIDEYAWWNVQRADVAVATPEI